MSDKLGYDLREAFKVTRASSQSYLALGRYILIPTVNLHPT